MVWTMSDLGRSISLPISSPIYMYMIYISQKRVQLGCMLLLSIDKQYLKWYMGTHVILLQN